ncbi:HNH endonuclease signature motif containing protein [Mycobacterium sp.]|uniref:HNH endonuclease signature motif containing protein n=1 Tax=Mycobacterium sp. TaxID=1785 RepID=UPI0025E4907D|nr:HNH endonuclease signature motif containing protein [Mycobacterium sp.]
MSSSTREEVVESLDALDAGLDRVCALSFDILTTPERLRVLERLEATARRLRVPGHALVTQLAEQAGDEELGGRLADALANQLRISRSEATRRIGEAADLGERRALTGESLSPRLTATAEAQRQGRIGDEHVAVIRSFFRRLPDGVDPLTQQAAEADLADKASEYRPDEVAKYAQVLMDCLNPDGNFTDADRARRRGVVVGRQEADGMSRIRGYLNPELRATFDAVLAKLAAPGMCNPDDATPVVDDDPSDSARRRDTRSEAQRNHDALLAGLRGLLMSGKLGQHNGLPTTIVVTTTLKELASAAGHGRVAGGSWLPMSDLVRLAGHAHHYLAIFDEGKPLALYHGKRLASPAQRIMLHARDRGCTKPGCTAPGYWTQAHHTKGWAATRRTDAAEMALACGPDNRLAEKGWTTRINARGEVEWIPPPHLDRGQPRVNTFHHPEKMLAPDEEPDAA